jgi:FkbM family methyltransferase
LSYICRIFSLFAFPGAIRAFLSWPKFSIASYLMVSRLKAVGVSPMTVIDVGANVGQFTVASHKIFKKAHILSIEANKSILCDLKKNTEQLSNVEIISSAVGDYDGMVDFFVNSDSQVSSILELGDDRKGLFPKSVVLRSELLSIARIDTLLKKKKLQEPILLKLDVQGAEQQVLLGAEVSLKKIRWVLVEISLLNLYQGETKFDEVYSLMKKNGFSIHGVMNYHMSPDQKSIMELDVLFSRM